ncbi:MULTISPECIES: TonB-dependent receptor [unclassified Maribacter]|uniref:TonB-dependent receptor n=1 Tax=unclassified Maribacter TaxID=2615042 RepID=UPI00257E638E|nr:MULTISPECIES: TonB-dependent receptor [unclassified Maribacter]|tara:strand:+ start:26076 stop:27830 length:1755 start_codon:yes stop_codon:yes gene_type:complete
MYNKHIFTLIFLTLGFQVTFAQEEEEKDLGTETVTVTKAYTPTVSDAFKIKSVPNMNDSIVLQKKPINYSIFSVPVASTFTPSKGTASKVEKLPPPVLYNSYASLGAGLYGNVLGEFYTSRTINRDENFDIGFNHLSSRGGINGVELNDTFYDTKLDASYAKRDRDLEWGAAIGLQHQLYNWYGIEPGVFSETVINSIDERQNYYMGEVSGHINVEDAYFKRADLKYRRFFDAVSSGENRAIFNTGFEFPMNEETFNAKVKLDYVGGTFENASVSSADNDNGISYGNLQVGINPSLTMLRDDLSLNLGVNLVYGMDLENSESNFYIYPAVTASYRLLDETVIAYGGVTGELKQNSYYDFVEGNPFVSPTLTIAPTDSQYNAYVGFKGQLLPNLSYNVKGSYTAENNKPLYTLNPRNDFRSDDKGYYYGNSFGLFYDDIKTLGIFGELNVDVNRNFTAGANIEVYDYNTETGNPAWNLPNLQASLFMDYQIGEKWYAGVNLFYVGEREDFSSTVVQNAQPSEFPATLITLDGYFDANAHVGYRYTDQWSFFIKGANLSNNDYQRWSNFQVQGIQILGGATYKFDF